MGLDRLLDDVHLVGSDVDLDDESSVRVLGGDALDVIVDVDEGDPTDHLTPVVEGLDGAALGPHVDRDVVELGGKVGVGRQRRVTAPDLHPCSGCIVAAEDEHQNRGCERADEVLQKKLRSLKNVEIITSGQTTEITGEDGKVSGLNYTDRNTGESRHVALEGVFVQIGLVPNTEWLKGSIELSQHGEIIVNDRNETSIPGVFAAGDATTVPYKQIVISMGEGSKAALSAFDYLIRNSAE